MGTQAHAAGSPAAEAGHTADRSYTGQGAGSHGGRGLRSGREEEDSHPKGHGVAESDSLQRDLRSSHDEGFYHGSHPDNRRDEGYSREAEGPVGHIRHRREAGTVGGHLATEIVLWPLAVEDQAECLQRKSPAAP